MPCEKQEMGNGYAHTSGPGQLSALDWLQKAYDYLLIVVVAPAGAGKTTLLRRWAEGCGRPIAWVTLGPEHNRPACLLSEIGAALYQVGLDFSYDNLALDETMDDGIVAFINAIVQYPAPLALILDNYHIVQSEVIHKGMRLLLDHIPPQLHLIIASRTEPPLQLARLRVRRQFLEVQLATGNS